MISSPVVSVELEVAEFGEPLELRRCPSSSASAVAKPGVRPSMGSVGDCYDNAMCESFFATLGCELIDRTSFRNHDEARDAIFDFIEDFYNSRRGKLLHFAFQLS